jgi:uncharacterized glyoxalase superfamily protein PhnB
VGVAKNGKRKKGKDKKARREKIKSPPKGMPQCSPYLYYAEPRRAVEWLEKAFGLEPVMSVAGNNGDLAHAELRFGKAVVMLGPAASASGTLSPRDLPAVNQSLYVYVEDIDAHCQAARAAGAAISLEPQEMFWGDRIYGVRDCEGHHWTFAQRVREVDPEEVPQQA